MTRKCGSPVPDDLDITGCKNYVKLWFPASYKAGALQVTLYLAT